MEKIIVNLNDVGKRIDNFLLKFYPQLQKALVFKLIRTNKVKVNKKKVKFDYRLKLHDEIEIFYNLNQNNNQENKLWFLDTKNKLNVVFEDKNIVIINKPVGLASQPTNNGDSVQKLLLKYLYESKQYDPDKENIFIPSICNRLDTNTAGMIVGAKNKQALDEMNLIFKNHDVIKKYQCLVIGNINPDSATLKHYHYKDKDKNIVYINNEPKQGYKEIITKYKKMDFNGKYSLVDVELVTGRTHQIRAHFNHIGYPLVGETKYKNKNTNVDTRFKYQALVSYYLKFNFNDLKLYPQLSYLNQKEFKLKDFWFKQLID